MNSPTSPESGDPSTERVTTGPNLAGAAVWALLTVVVGPAVLFGVIVLTNSVEATTPGTLVSFYVVLMIGGCYAGGLWIWQALRGRVDDRSVRIRGGRVLGRAVWPGSGTRGVRLDRLRSVRWLRVTMRSNANQRVQLNRLLLRDHDGGSLVVEPRDGLAGGRLLPTVRQAVRGRPDVRVPYITRKLLAGEDPRFLRWLITTAAILAGGGLVTLTFLVPTLLD